ncbi:3'-5' exonuclease [Desulfosporosinus meridiei]|uniref:Inhibitor of the KinA pathway to sporulation, predicted exonuclease n=1 Tax=Desulfosporosinus meridiei (strain ATCC BAA-275 / DSM 13257 / KCTC 12902 / NCIMB 13706 / S10) TaxID=768704 RepID=J7IMF4_DESMD|nr:3'-5' exonuclease [Desulfosporosinus meridiei]AFQ42765.1 inhibitor of the KinA pathway to sporulation, predicted exonuclease [Desulfosporosinus meridiei DSM 13257]
MNYIVFDLEFNMFFKFNEGDYANPSLKSEIIQIGAVKLNENLETIGEFNSIIRPVVYKRINPYVKKKTNINSHMVIKGKAFNEAIKSFSDWVDKDPVLCSWGHDDMLGLRDNCLFFGIDSLSFDKYINIQQIYMKREGLAMQPSLESAVESLKIEKTSPFHDALSDAFYTAEIFKEVFDDSNSIIDWGKVQKENEEKIRELKALLAKVSIHCPECDKILQKTREMTKAKKYFAHSYCDNCKLPVRHISRITQNGNGEYRISSKDSIYKAEESADSQNT